MSRLSNSGWSARAIAASVERSVHDGRFKPSGSLPPVRELAKSLGVSPATVAAAYRLLKARGLTAAQGRRGTRVNRRPPSPAGCSAAPVPAGVTDLRSGNPDPLLLPSLGTALRAVHTEQTMYGAAALLPSLHAFAAEELKTDGVPAGGMTLAAGALDAIERILREELRPGDHVAIEDPAFPLIKDLATATGYVAVPLEVDDEGPLPASLAGACARGCRAAIVTPRAQNPFGSALTPDRARDLAAVLRTRPEVLVIENDACGPVSGTPLVTLCDPARRRWAHVRSTSKFLSPDLRLAFIVGDSLTVNRVEGRLAMGSRWISHVLQHLAHVLWSDPANGRQIARAADLYRQRRLALLAALKLRGIDAHGASGLNVWIPARHEARLVHDLADRGWAVAAGEPFRMHTPPGIRVTTAVLAPADAARFADDLAAVLRSDYRPSA